MAYQDNPLEIVGESTFWVLIKEIFLNRWKLSFTQFVEIESTKTLNDDVKVFDWARENLIGRWHIRLCTVAQFTTATGFENLTKIVAKFSRQEDAMAFKLRWI